MVGFEDLPVELLEYIFSFLSPDDVTRLHRVSTLWAALVAHPGPKLTNVGKATVRHAFVLSCRQGDLPIAHWLVKRFSLTADDARAHRNAALRGACHGGFTETAQWLVERFDLTANDARAWAPNHCAAPARAGTCSPRSGWRTGSN